MAQEMTDAQWRAFVAEGTRTGKLATVRADGSPHVVPIWFVLDGDDLVFNTGRSSVKGRNLLRDPRAALTVDEEQPPYAFVTARGRQHQRGRHRDAPLVHPDRRALHGRGPRRAVRPAQRGARGTAGAAAGGAVAAFTGIAD